MATYNNIKKIKIGDNTFNLYDSGGTITSVKTTAGAHNTIDVTSGAVSFNVPTKTSHLTNDSGFITSYTETDPTVPSWAKASTKPTYTASEVGAISGNVGGVFFGTCSTAAGTVAKVVNCADFTTNDLKAGTIIIVSFTETNSGAGASLTMNVNSTGAKPIKYINNGTLGNIYSAGYLKANTEYPFYYDGANWVVLFNVNTTYTAISESEMETGTATTGRLITAARLKEAVEYHAPVTSVNGSTGAVTISVPTKTSELTNDSGFINTSTATPTANTVSKFDSSAHMNSSDMSSQDITSFVNALDTQGTNLVDYVVGTGIDGIWTYRKWASGLYDAWYEGDVNLLAGTAWGSGFYWHQSSSALDPPSFSQSVTALTGASSSGRLAMFCGRAGDYSQYWATGTSAASSLPVRLDMHGTWQ